QLDERFQLLPLGRGQLAVRVAVHERLHPRVGLRRESHPGHALDQLQRGFHNGSHRILLRSHNLLDYPREAAGVQCPWAFALTAAKTPGFHPHGVPACPPTPGSSRCSPSASAGPTTASSPRSTSSRRSSAPSARHSPSTRGESSSTSASARTTTWPTSTSATPSPPRPT